MCLRFLGNAFFWNVLPRAPFLLVIVAWSLLHASSGLAAASDADTGLPPAVLPHGVGVNIHFTRGHAQDLDLIAAAGFKFVRMDFAWGATERTKGRYVWDDYDELTANLERRGLRALYILDYSNGLYEDAIRSRDPISGTQRTDIAAPRKPDSVEAFARWAAAAAGHFRGRGILWEIWNEPNIGFWKPQPNVRDYATLALATCRAIREADPHAMILAPASSGFPWPFFETLFESGALEHLDAVSVHPYRSYSQSPETAAGDYLRLRALIERHASPAKQRLPIVSGEWGYATHTNGVSPDTQAAFVARQQLANLYRNIPLSIWYDWKNDGLDPDEREHNFGVVTHDLQPKPAYHAVQTLTAQLGGYRVVRRLTVADLDAWVLLCVDPTGRQKLAAWTSGKPAAARLDLGLELADAVSAVDGFGQARELRIEHGALVIELEALPQYIAFSRPIPPLAAAAAWTVEPPATRLIAGQAPARIVIKLTNPFDYACEIRLALDGLDSDNTATVRVAAGQQTEHALTLAPQRRDNAFPTARVCVSYWRAADRDPVLVSVAEQQLAFALANPLRLAVAPREAGIAVTLIDSAGLGFEGEMVIDGQAVPVSLAAGTGTFAAPIRSAASEDGLHVEVRTRDGRSVLPATVFRLAPLAATGFRTVLDGDSQISASATLGDTRGPPGSDAPFSRVWRLEYRFDPGWRFVRCVTDAGRPEIVGRPDAFGVWVYGDGSGNSLRIRVTDQSGQTFQPIGPALDWTGWRWVSFDLSSLEHAGRWGGANDGIVHGRLRLDTVLLIDSTREQTAGTIYFAGPTFIGSSVDSGQR